MTRDEVTQEDRKTAKAIYFAYKRSDLPCEGAKLAAAHRTASEQRGYDRAIAEVVAMLADIDPADIRDGARGALIFIQDAIEAGEHKP